MHYYSGLLKKEWRLSWKGLWQGYAFIIAAWLGSMGASIYWNEPSFSLALGLLLIVSHLFYIAIDLGVSLSREAKLKLWLHNPNPALSLLTSKLVISVASCLLSLFLVIGLMLVTGHIFQAPVGLGNKVWENAIFLFQVISISLYLGAWQIFFWTFKRCMQTKGLLGALQQVMLIFMVGVILYFHQYFLSSSLFAKLKAIGTIPFMTVGTEFEADAFSFGLEMGEFSLVLMAIFTIIIIMLLLASAWLIDRKIEL